MLKLVSNLTIRLQLAAIHVSEADITHIERETGVLQESVGVRELIRTIGKRGGSSLGDEPESREQVCDDKDMSTLSTHAHRLSSAVIRVSSP